MNQKGDMTAIQGTFVKIGTMADGTPRIVLDLQCKLEDVAAMGLIPGVPFALARITAAASVAASNKDKEPKDRIGPLCLLACQFCDDHIFWNWINTETSSGPVTNELEAKETLLFICRIDSRKELDTDSRAADTFHRQIRKPFMAWRDSARMKVRAI